MKVGDLVVKSSGHTCLNSMGIVLEVATNDKENTIVIVNVEGEIKKWYRNFVEVIDEKG